jgi:hypothetical protein
MMVLEGIAIRPRWNPMWVELLSCRHTLIAYVKYGTDNVGVPPVYLTLGQTQMLLLRGVGGLGGVALYKVQSEG